MKQQLDLTLGLALQDEGIRQALEHADAEHWGWQEIARAYLEAFMRLHPGREFMGCHVRTWAEENGCPLPPQDRAWGGIIQGAAKRRAIIRVGYGPTETPSAHAAPVSIWRQAHGN